MTGIISLDLDGRLEGGEREGTVSKNRRRTIKTDDGTNNGEGSKSAGVELTIDGDHDATSRGGDCCDVTDLTANCCRINVGARNDDEISGIEDLRREEEFTSGIRRVLETSSRYQNVASTAKRNTRRRSRNDGGFVGTFKGNLIGSEGEVIEGNFNEVDFTFFC